MKRTLSVRLDEEDLKELESRAMEMRLTPSTLARLLIRTSLLISQSPLLLPVSVQPPGLPENQETQQASASETLLSSRERSILSGLAEGHTNQRLAHTLGVSPETIKRDIAAIIRKLSANDRTHAVVLGIRQGHIRPNG